MKYVFAAIGMLIGQVTGGLIADSRVVEWILGTILFVVGYQLPAFIRYTKSSPKQLLAFHGPNSPITRSTSSGELRNLCAQLHEGGLLFDFHPTNNFAKVDGVQWANLVESERLTLAQVLMQAQAVDATAIGNIRILERDGTFLARYSATENYEQS